MPTDLSDRPINDSPSKRWRRDTIAEHLTGLEDSRREEPVSIRHFADRHGIPKSTLHDWQQRKRQLPADPRVIDFFESPQGLLVLHAIVLAAHMVFSFIGHAGIRPITRFLSLAGLAPFLACSYGAQQAIAHNMTAQILAFEAEQRPRLAKTMPHRRMTVCEDETFPKGGMCLVARDPVSRYLLAETFENRRDADTWDAVLERATADLNVEVIQQTGDEASGLLAHARHQNLHHSPDLFHVLNDINKATVLPLKRRIDAAEAAVATAVAQTRRHQAQAAAYRKGPRPRGHPPDFETRIARAQAVEDSARAALDAAVALERTRHAAVAGISSAYHPFDLQTGSARTAPAVEALLLGHFKALDGLAASAGLSQRSLKLLAKSRRRIPQMVATVGFFWGEVGSRISAMRWRAPVEAAFRSRLLPAAYLSRVAKRAPLAEARHALEAVVAGLLAPLRVPDGVLSHLEPAARSSLEKLAWDCADVFQRSSSCVEGRNGALALAEHARRGLPQRRLQALTIISNYGVVGEEGTTAAERFFGQQHDDLFEWLLTTMPLPARPARKRPRPSKQTLLKAA
ncbi:MAG: DUF6399 domain-containing protein [Myxococcota bacterium]|jgi:hypothetical protein|nr:DUF6399 domain-containing protein [Myxococcota bacterium]